MNNLENDKDFQKKLQKGYERISIVILKRVEKICKTSLNDKNTIKDFVSAIRIKDGKDFNKYVDSIESGIDLNITVGTPGGGSVDTFLPLNLGFFWPDIRI